MQVKVSSEIGKLLDDSAAICCQRNHVFVGVDHLFDAVVDSPQLLPPAFAQRHLGDLQMVAREVGRQGWRGATNATSGDLFYTPRCANALGNASRLAERMRQGAARSGHLLMAILGDAQSVPSRVMDGMRIPRGELLKALRNELLKMPPLAVSKPPPRAITQPPSPAQPQGAVPAVERAEAPGGFSIDDITRDLTQAAREGKLDPAIGRDEEMFEILQILARRGKNNVMLLGEAGVGKTQIIEGMALAGVQGTMGGMLSNYRILELNIGALMSGTQYRGAFEEKVLALLEDLKRSPEIIMFIDEVHLIMGAGSTDGDSMDVANLLRPALARGEIRCIGATTLNEYRKFVEKDPAIERRFQMVRVEQLSESATLQVLAKLRPALEQHHGVHIGSRAIEAAVALTQRYMPNRNLPDKAIDVLDQACARYRLKVIAAANNPAMLQGTMLPGAGVQQKVTPHDIRKVVSQLTSIPIEEMTSQERLFLSDLERRLKQQLIGQDEAVSKAVAAVKQSRAGLADPNRPQGVMLFLGPSGVGKTQLAKLLADALFGSVNHLVTFDMSEYTEEHTVSRLLGAPPGYVGADEEGRLSAAIRNAPFSILLFDEIEKAHPRIFDIFLPIFDEGRLKDSHGRDVNFKNCFIIMTSNIGADILRRSESDADRKQLMEELRGHFRPELINRIDEIIPFYPLLFEDVRSIL
ncbi:MAG: ATP-dependent Clp protease ATP-binding subunit, partial [Candidatus Hydrogenedentes bacterium]|nr:ATP-dependent Clp protease ATP-binding subunit [Candidatus Hydrogenedentota bacterium]